MEADYQSMRVRLKSLLALRNITLKRTDYSSDELAVSYRQLADQIGNLLSRISSPRLLAKMQPWTSADRNAELDAQLESLREMFETRMEEVEISQACEGVMDLIATVGLLLLRLSSAELSIPNSAVLG